MKIMISSRTGLLIIMFVSFMLICSSSIAQPPICNDFGSVDVDEVCGFLYNEELRKDDRVGAFREGIALFLDYEDVGGDTNYFVRVGLDTTEVQTRTWGKNSDFTWTFNGSGDPSPDNDPKFEFHDYRTKHIGLFEVEATRATDESNFAGRFQLYQTGFVREKGDSALYCVL